MEDSDQAAVRATLSGDKDSYRTLVVRHSPSLFRVAFRITGNEADADEAVQEAFLRGYQKLESFQLRSSFRTWIYRIAVRCALDRVSHRKGEEYGSIEQPPGSDRKPLQVADEAAGPERLLLSHEMGAMQEAALHSLTPIERTAFVLRHVEGVTTEEIGAALGITPNAAKQAVFRAVQKLRGRLAPLRVNV
ncbi:MAG: RNA polymerase sigma factor [Terriglobales bacterium]